MELTRHRSMLGEDWNMRIVYALTPDLQQYFKKPFGKLLRGSSLQTMKQLKAIIASEKPPTIISVGDTVSKNLHKHGITPQVSITDNKSLRRTIKPLAFGEKRVVRIQNPPSTITDEAESAIRDALKCKEHIHMVVIGEEDLLTPVAVLYAPENALVVYGQPHRGVVVVKATVDKKARAKELLDAMACLGKDK